MKIPKKTYNPCDDCQYSYSKQNQESNTCRICEFKKILDAEEQGLILRLPCKIGDDVYLIPSKVNYDLNVLSKHKENNRVYHQKVARIVITDGHWYIECDKDIEYGTDRICIDLFYKETWFLAKEEAEQALAKMKEGVT